IEDGTLRVAVADGEVALRGFRTADGRPVALSELIARLGWRIGTSLPEPDPETAERLGRLHRELARHERHWVRRLAALRPLPVPKAERAAGLAGEASPRVVDSVLP